MTFLDQIYNSIAETLPDFKDELGASSAVQMNLNNDPYAKVFHDECADPDLLQRSNPKPRKQKGQVQINLARTSKTMEEKWLPPGSMKEYYDQYVAQSGLEKPGSFPSFWRVSCSAWFHRLCAFFQNNKYTKKVRCIFSSAFKIILHI